MLTARTVEAVEARALGLVDVMVEAGDLDAAVEELTSAILANSAHTNRHTKRILRETEAMPLAQALAHEQYTYPGYAPDYEERVAAFKKR
jgi:enoyl-CoA hydratase